MKRLVNNVVSIVFTTIKFSIIKLFHWKRFKYKFIQRFSPNTDIYFIGKGKLILGQKVRAHSNVKLRVVNNGKLIIEENVSFNYGCMVTCQDYVHIKAGVQFGSNVLIYDNDHDFKAPGGLSAKKYLTGKVIIGKNTWIGANAIILRDTVIGDNCVVGAGSVLKGKFEDNSLIYQKRDTIVKKIIN